MADTIRVAVAQCRIERDVRANGVHIRSLLDIAASQGAELVLFPEGALSGYAKSQIRDWAELDWNALAEELAATSDHAAGRGVAAVVGAAHPVEGRRPYNSLHALPVGGRYDKRYLSLSEVADWYTPGFSPMLLEQQGFAFGFTLCIELQFPELFGEYERLGADCLLHGSYGLGPLGDVILQGHAATNCLWLAAATPANVDEPSSGIVGPDGRWIARCKPGIDVAVATLDRADPRYDVALNKARPWRRVAREGSIYRGAI